MKTFTYAAAIALLTASAAFAQSSSNNSSMMNNSTPTPTMSGPSEGNGGMSSQSATSPSEHGSSISGSMSGDHSSSASGSMSGDQSKASPDMDQSKASSDMDRSSDHASMRSNEKTMSKHHVASQTKAPRHIARRGSAQENTRENQETAQLNRQQISGSAMNEGMSANMAGTNDVHRNPFNNGSPQQAQAGGANCTPDRPDCGTARRNPAINSSPQQRTYNAAPH